MLFSWFCIAVAYTVLYPIKPPSDSASRQRTMISSQVLELSKSGQTSIEIIKETRQNEPVYDVTAQSDQSLLSA